MIEMGMEPDVTAYSILLDGYASEGDLSDMRDLLDLMLANGI
jgi:pentatricopeptide repeat protein